MSDETDAVTDPEVAVLCALLRGLASLDSEARHRIVDYANRWLRDHVCEAADPNLITWYLAARQVAVRGTKGQR